jgi:hypothetical protein
MPTASPLRATWVPLSYLAHEERMDPRTLKKQPAGQPFVQRLGPRMLLVNTDAFATWRARRRPR